MKKNNLILLTVVVITLLTIIVFATYAYFASNATVVNAANINAMSEQNNMVFDTFGGSMSLDVRATNMSQANNGTMAVENNTTLTVNFTSNTEYSMVCSYDIVYEWTSTDKYQTHSPGVTSNEFTIQAELASNAHVSEGTNNIHNETDLTTAVGNQNSAVVVQGAQIDGTGSTTSTAVWTLTSKFYNAVGNQAGLAGKTFEGRFKVANVSCVAGTASGTSSSGPTSYWFSTTLSTWNDSTNQYEPNYTYPATGGTVQTSGSGTGHNVYIGQDNSKYYACAISDHEVCLSQPYTQYGLTGHTYCNDDSCLLTSEQQASAMQAIYQVLIDAGITGDINYYCEADEDDAHCYVGDLYCEVRVNGYVICYDTSEYVNCGVDPLGHAYCET